MADFLKAVVGGIGNLLGGLLPGTCNVIDYNRLTYGNTSVLNCVGHFWFFCMILHVQLSLCFECTHFCLIFFWFSFLF